MSVFKQPWFHTVKIMTVAYLLVAALLLWAGAQPDEYMIHVRGITTAQTYPFSAVGIELLLLFIACLLQARALTAHSWSRVRRLGFCLILNGGLGVPAAMGVMHAPLHYIYFVLAVFFLALADLLLVVIFCILGWIAA